MFCLSKKIIFISLLIAVTSIKCLATFTAQELETVNIIILKILRGEIDSNMIPAQVKMKLAMVFLINELMKFRKNNQMWYMMRNEQIVAKNSFNKEQNNKPTFLRFFY